MLLLGAFSVRQAGIKRGTSSLSLEFVHNLWGATDARAFAPGHVQVEELVGQWPFIGGYLFRAYGQYFNGSSPVPGHFGLEGLRIGIGIGITRLGALADCGRRIVHPDPAISGVKLWLVRGIQYDVLLALDLANDKQVLLSNNLVCLLLALSSKLVNTRGGRG